MKCIVSNNENQNQSCADSIHFHRSDLDHEKHLVDGATEEQAREVWDFRTKKTKKKFKNCNRNEAKEQYGVISRRQNGNKILPIKGETTGYAIPISREIDSKYWIPLLENVLTEAEMITILDSSNEQYTIEEYDDSWG